MTIWASFSCLVHILVFSVKFTIQVNITNLHCSIFYVLKELELHLGATVCHCFDARGVNLTVTAVGCYTTMETKRLKGPLWGRSSKSSIHLAPAPSSCRGKPPHIRLSLLNYCGKKNSQRQYYWDIYRKYGKILTMFVELIFNLVYFAFWVLLWWITLKIWV